MKSYVQKRKPYRTRKQQDTRLKWCKEHVDWSEQAWRNVVFSDESHFEILNRKNRTYVRRTPTEKDKPFSFQTRSKRGGGSVSVWGCVSAEGVGPLDFYDGRLNAASYTKLISQSLPSYLAESFDSNSQDIIFMQDNAPCHRAKSTKKWFKDNNISLLDWPPACPDINIIENIWKDIDQSLHKYPISNKEQLRCAIEDIWSKYTKEQCVNLVNSIPRRIKRIIKARGGNVSRY